MKRRLNFPLSLAYFAVLVTFTGAAQSSGGTTQKQQAREIWTDPNTGLTWASKDSGKDLSWKAAMKYCRVLRLSRFSDWRLANLFELQGIYDKTVESPGLAGKNSEEPFNWHVKGSLFLTANEWASTFGKDDRSYRYYFDFNEGKSNNDPTGWPYPHTFRRALCVRGSGDPLGGQRKH